ncbi:hypothetical protein Micbo1qcDRAFT_167735, partial [Microdochium bolleyi]
MRPDGGDGVKLPKPPRLGFGGSTLMLFRRFCPRSAKPIFLLILAQLLDYQLFSVGVAGVPPNSVQALTYAAAPSKIP